jgi:hypothetical protein
MVTPAHPIAGSDDTTHEPASLATAAPTSPRDTFALALAALDAALELIYTVGTELPTLPSDPDGETVGNPDWSPCCAAGDLRVITVGLEQWCRIDVVNGKWNASTNGWNDMGDMTGPEYVQCAACGAAFSVPDELSWDGM